MTAGPHAKRVLIVDDDEALLQLITGWVRGAGHEVVPFNSFETARTYLATAQPDVMISDVRLGAFNGIQLVVFAKLQRPEMVAVVSTGYDDPVLREEAAKTGAAYLVKPFTAGQLLDTINHQSEQPTT